MSFKYELTGDAKAAEFAVPGTGELVRLEKGKSVELQQRISELPPDVKVSEIKPKKGADENASAEEAS